MRMGVSCVEASYEPLSLSLPKKDGSETGRLKDTVQVSERIGKLTRGCVFWS